MDAELKRCHGLNHQKRFDEAREILSGLWKTTQNHRVLHNLAATEREAGNFERALELFQEERTLLKSDDHLALAANAYEHGILHLEQGNLTLAKEASKECFDHTIETDDPVMRACAYRLFGDVAVAEGDGTTARDYFKKARQIFLALKDEDAIADIDKRMA